MEKKTNRTEWVRKSALLCVAAMLVTALAAVKTPTEVSAASKATLYEMNAKVELYNSADGFSVGIKNAKLGGTYTATVSNDKIAELKGYTYGIYDDGSSGWLGFWAKKTGKVNVTVKEKNGSTYKKIGTERITIKKSDSYKDTAYSRKEKSYLKKKVTWNDGASLEVIGIKSIVKSGKTSKVTFELDHAVTDAEYKASGGYYVIHLLDKKGDLAAWIGTEIKKGDTTLSADVKDLKKGTTYYSYGFSRAKRAGISFSAKCK